MPMPVKVVLYLVILVGLAYIVNSIPRAEHDSRLLIGLVFLGWFIGGVLIIFRAAFRFITR